MKKLNKDSKKKLLNFLNESQVRVGKKVESLVDRLVLNNSKERAGDIGELIAELFLKNNVNSFSNVQNANDVLSSDFPFADIICFEGNKPCLISVKASSDIGKRALGNSKVYSDKIISMLEKENLKEFLKSKNVLPESGESFDIILGIISIDISLPKALFSKYKQKIQDIAERTDIEDITEDGKGIEAIAALHGPPKGRTFEIIGGKLYFKNTTTQVKKVKDFMRWSSYKRNPLWKAWEKRAQKQFVSEMFGGDNFTAFVNINFYEQNVTIDNIGDRLFVSEARNNVLFNELNNGNKNYFRINPDRSTTDWGFELSRRPPFNGKTKEIASSVSLTDVQMEIPRTYGGVWRVLRIASDEGLEDQVALRKYDSWAGLERKLRAADSGVIAKPMHISAKNKRIELYKQLNNLLYFYLNNKDFQKVVDAAKEIVKTNNPGLKIETVIAESLVNLLVEKKKRRKKRRRSKCTPARRRINSGGKAGSYADPRTGGKQAYAALKKAKPPGSKGGWTKKKCICCHKCPNDRSAPNGFVCTNPSHLYWGTKADNTYDQNRGNGWAARNNKNEGDPKGEKAFAYEIMIGESKIRSLIEKIIRENSDSAAWFGKSFLDFKNDVDSGISPLNAAKTNLKEIGRGSTRIVFEFSDNSDIVLKVINTEAEAADSTFRDLDGNPLPAFDDAGNPRTKYGFFKSNMIISNQNEADLVMQQKYPDVFPMTFERSSDFSWILAERGYPVGSWGELINSLGITNNFSRVGVVKKYQFMDMIKRGAELVSLQKSSPGQINEDTWETIPLSDISNKKKTMATFAEDPLAGPTSTEDPLDQKTIKLPPAETVKIETAEDKRVKELLKSQHNRQILLAISELKIPPREISPKNMGISKITDKLMIIDASLWEEK